MPGTLKARSHLRRPTWLRLAANCFRRYRQADRSQGKRVSAKEKSEREKRLVKALRDNLRRRKASHGDAAVTAGKPNARPVPKRPAKGNDLS